MTDIDDDPRRMLDRLLTEKGWIMPSWRASGATPPISSNISSADRRDGWANRTGRASPPIWACRRRCWAARRCASPRRRRARRRDLVLVPKLAIGASAGPGASVDGEAVEGEVAFDPRWLRDLGADPRALSIIRVEGDSMAPTLGDGDDILVDGGDAAARLRDGIYVLRMDDVLMVKRIARAPGPGRVSVISDNPHYRSWDDLPLSAIRLVGRVIWTGRRVR